jgi:replicative DNA helicase
MSPEARETVQGKKLEQARGQGAGVSPTDISLERGLPVNLEAERGILAAILLDNAHYDAAAEKLTEDHFSLAANRRIFACMRSLQERGRAIDEITLVEELDRHKEVEAIGGVAYLSSLIDGVPERTSIEHWVRIVREKALLRGAINIGQNVIAEALEHSDDPEEIVARAEMALSQLNDHAGQQTFQTMAEIVRQSFKSLDELCQARRDVTGLETHYSDFDRLTGGLQPADLIILAARPSMGKTALAMNIAENVGLKDGKVVGVFSLEMSKKALLLRMISSVAHIDSIKVRNGTLNMIEANVAQQALEKLMDSGINVDDTPAITMSEMRSKARRLKRANKGKLDLLVVDYLQLMGRPAGLGKGTNREQEVSMNSRGLKALAKELGVPVLVLAQLNRNTETRSDHRPQLSDLRESGSIEQDADVVAFIFREEVYKRDDPDVEGIAELIVAKQRNGPTDTVKLAWLRKQTKFENLSTFVG